MTSGLDEGQRRASTTAAAAAKAALRAELLAARGARRPDPAADLARTRLARQQCAGHPVVAAYASRPGEPDTLTLIEELRQAGVQVLLPVLSREPTWAVYTGPAGLAPGPMGIPQPHGERLGPQALRSAGWIWLPGLAGTVDGRRLGAGGGWYDRALEWADPGSPRGLLLFDSEVLADLPTEEWDQHVDLLVTELRLLAGPE